MQKDKKSKNNLIITLVCIFLIYIYFSINMFSDSIFNQNNEYKKMIDSVLKENKDTGFYVKYKFYEGLGLSGTINAVGYTYLMRGEYNKALPFFYKAAMKNQKNALNNLGCMYLDGQGVPKSGKKALEYFKKSAELGHPNAMYNIGLMYYKGQEIEQDYNLAFEYLNKSANNGNPQALLILGNMYYNGQGVGKNYRTAFEILNYIIEKCGYSEENAQMLLAWMYEQGLGTKQNYKKAFQLYRTSATQKIPFAVYNLAYFYENGLGTTKDEQKAEYWYNKLGSVEEKEKYKNMREKYLEELEKERKK